MAVKNTRKRLAIIVIASLVVIIATAIVIALSTNSSKKDPYAIKNNPPQTTNDQSDSSPTDSSQNNTQSNSNDTTKNNTQPTQDPATVATIDIAQLNITVSYVKGIEGFAYQIQRAPKGSQYVEFYSDSLTGTKCSDDDGQFASILVNPDSNEKATVTKTTTVDGVTYGLSLSANTCTANPDLLTQYQKSFSDAFGLLKKTK